MRVVIAAAGTAGHINPGIAIANKIKREEKGSKIIFIDIFVVLQYLQHII